MFLASVIVVYWTRMRAIQNQSVIISDGRRLVAG